MLTDLRRRARWSEALQLFHSSQGMIQLDVKSNSTAISQRLRERKLVAACAHSLEDDVRGEGLA